MLLTSFLARTGRCLHQPGERGVRLHARPRAGRRRGDQRVGSSGLRADMPVPVVLVHGQRDQLPAEAVSGGGLQGEVLGQVCVCVRQIWSTNRTTMSVSVSTGAC